MRALTRIRTLAAALTLLLFIATTALAGVPGRPKDRPEGPGEPSPAEIGDPDMGGNLTRDHIWYQLIASTMDNSFFRRILTSLRMRLSARPSAPTLPPRGR